MMKFKPNQTRTYDREGYKKRAACLCFRSEREDEVLLVSSSRYPDQWIVPGGGMEPEEEPGGAAVREVYEEGNSCSKVQAQISLTDTKLFRTSSLFPVLLEEPILSCRRHTQMSAHVFVKFKEAATICLKRTKILDSRNESART